MNAPVIPARHRADGNPKLSMKKKAECQYKRVLGKDIEMNQVTKKEDIQSTELTKSSPITPMQMLQTAVDQGADLDKLQKLMDLQERWEASEAKKAYVISMAQFRDKCPNIDKTRAAHNSKYAGLAETIDQIKNLLSECGLSHSWKTNQENVEITVTCCITHTQGHQESTSLTAPPDGTGSKNTIQAIGSTVTYLQRYTLFSVLGLASKEQDNDGANMAVYINLDQKEELITLIKETGADVAKFLKYLGVPSVDEIWAKKFAEAKAALEKKRNK
jgi:hypothetical protein